MPKYSFTKTPTSLHINCFQLNFYHNISVSMFENIRQDSFWQWKWQLFLTLKMFCLTLIIGICWRGWCEVTNSIGGRPLLFHKSKGILHGTLYFDLDSAFHFTLYTFYLRFPDTMAHYIQTTGLTFRQREFYMEFVSERNVSRHERENRQCYCPPNGQKLST